MLYHVKFKSVFDVTEKGPAVAYIEAENIIQAIEILREEMGPSHALAINDISLVHEYPVLRKVYKVPGTYTVDLKEVDDD